jgi:hypothetical protein
VTLDISPQTEARLFDVARQEGIDPAALVERLVKEYRPAPGADRTADELYRKLRERQEQDHITLRPDRSAAEHFARLEAEAAQMTDEEREAEDRIWEDFQNGMNETRAALGMRQL